MLHKNIVEFELWGDYALFSDPIMRVGGEKCTYQVPTYEALKGVMSSIYWKPTLIWIVDAVRIMNQIQTEVKGIRTLKYSKEKTPNDLSYYTYLKDCRYQVRAHFIWNENRPDLAHDQNEHKHHNIARRMVEKGGRRDIFLGARECQGYVEPCVFGEGDGYYDGTPELAFGLMHHGFTYADEAHSPETEGRMSLRMWRPVMRRGIIEFPLPEQCPIVRPIGDMGVKPFGREHNNFSGIAEFSGEVE